MIINNMTDTDFYKLSQQQAVWHQYPKAKGRYELDIRTKDPAFPLADIIDKIRDEIMSFSQVSLTNDEYKFLESKPWFKHDYLDWLAEFRMNPEEEYSKIYAFTDGTIRMSASGFWHKTILYEVPSLSVVEELYCRHAYNLSDEEALEAAISRLKPQVELLKNHPNLRFTDFGTRRRHSKAVQNGVLAYLKDNCPNLSGTSNVWFAKEFGLMAVGTVAHEWTMGHLALSDRIENAQKRALHVWLQEYGEMLGTALSDTFTSKAFWNDFDIVLSKAYSGVRQDSGDPFTFGRDAINHYKKLGIDPRTKSVIFSDALDFQKVINLYEQFVGEIGIGFGIGTNLTNNLGYKPLSIVMKLLSLNGTSLVKISDSSGKVMGDPNMVEQVCTAYGIEL